jgi:hypothetical protein
MPPTGWSIPVQGGGRGVWAPDGGAVLCEAYGGLEIVGTTPEDWRERPRWFPRDASDPSWQAVP